MRAVAVMLLVSFAAPVWAQQPPAAVGLPTPYVPQTPDEPLPEWRMPPPRRDSHAFFLSLSPELQYAQRLRQVGIWLSSLGWCAVFGGGIVYVKAAGVNQDIGHFAAGDSGDGRDPINRFNPAQERLRDQYEQAAFATMGGGAALAVTGFIVFTVGQWKINVWHQQRPRDPLPSMSGF